MDMDMDIWTWTWTMYMDMDMNIWTWVAPGAAARGPARAPTVAKCVCEN
jgi:hypothetical protein